MRVLGEVDRAEHADGHREENDEQEGIHRQNDNREEPALTSGPGGPAE